MISRNEKNKIARKSMTTLLKGCSVGDGIEGNYTREQIFLALNAVLSHEFDVIDILRPCVKDKLDYLFPIGKK